MKLLLTSLPSAHTSVFKQFVSELTNKTVTVIPTARYVYAPERYEPMIAQLLTNLKTANLDPTLLDLAKTSQSDLAKQLRQSSLVIVMGGNTFYLNYHAHKSGFIKLVQELVPQGLLYVGESAGATLAGPTLHGIEFADDPAQAPETIWKPLNLINYGIIPHWGNPKYASILEQCHDEMAKFTAVKTISDQQGILIDGDNHAFVEIEAYA